MASSNLSQLAFVEETVFGTTPAAALQILRMTGGQITPTQNTIISQEIRADLRAGRPVRTSQIANGEINVEWSASTLDNILEGMLFNDWATGSGVDTLVDGTTQKSFTFEDQILDLSPTVFRPYRGCRISSLNLSAALESIVTGSFGLMGAIPAAPVGTTTGTGTALAATGTEPWNTVEMVETLTEAASGGAGVALSRVIGLDINMTREIRPKMEFGNINAFDLGVSRLIVNGSVQLHFETSTQLTAWQNFTDRSLTIEFQDLATNSLTIEIPKLKYTGDAEVSQPGVDNDRILTLNFEAYALAADPALIRFTRSYV